MFFVSLLAHELAHAFFAVRAGVRVEGITLWLLGGVAKLDGDAPTPGHDLRIAASGPIVSGLLGIGFGGLAVWLSTAGVAPLIAEAATWLARVNLLLAVFNLLPGAPLDGGRIVRAVAWRLGRDRLRAALVATRIGRVLGFGLVAFGMLELILGADLGGIWTIVIGLFLTGAAAAERDVELARDAARRAAGSRCHGPGTGTGAGRDHRRPVHATPSWREAGRPPRWPSRRVARCLASPALPRRRACGAGDGANRASGTSRCRWPRCQWPDRMSPCSRHSSAPRRARLPVERAAGTSWSCTTERSSASCLPAISPRPSRRTGRLPPGASQPNRRPRVHRSGSREPGTVLPDRLPAHGPPAAESEQAGGRTGRVAGAG